jgi:hypothetical protein
VATVILALERVTEGQDEDMNAEKVRLTGVKETLLITL